MRLRWTPSAASDLESIHNYLCQHHPALAQPTIRFLYATVQSLRTFPMRGRTGEAPGTRELVLERLPYILVYRLTEHAVEIIRIHHSAQDRRPKT